MNSLSLNLQQLRCGRLSPRTSEVMTRLLEWRQDNGGIKAVRLHILHSISHLHSIYIYLNTYIQRIRHWDRDVKNAGWWQEPGSQIKWSRLLHLLLHLFTGPALSLSPCTRSLSLSTRSSFTRLGRFPNRRFLISVFFCKRTHLVA